MHSNTVNNSRITVATPGKYLVEVRVTWAYDVSGTIRRFRTLINGIAQEAISDQYPNGTVPKTTPQLVAAYALKLNDYVQVDVDHDATGAVLFTPLSFGITLLTP